MTESTDMMTGEVALTIAGEAVTMRVTVPSAPTGLDDLLPIFHALTDAVVKRSVASDAAPGRTVSCRAGCAACCRHPVPLAPSEARTLAAIVAAMPEPKRRLVRRRFAAARAKLAAAGVGITPAAIARLSTDEQFAWEEAYIDTWVACPFLEDEACSIYPDRPVICREYVVTTPAANCRTPKDDTIRRVPLHSHVSAAIAAVDRRLDGDGLVFLVDSLDYASSWPAPRPCETGPALVQAVFATVAEQSKV